MTISGRWRPSYNFSLSTQRFFLAFNFIIVTHERSYTDHIMCPQPLTPIMTSFPCLCNLNIINERIVYLNLQSFSQIPSNRHSDAISVSRWFVFNNGSNHISLLIIFFTSFIVDQSSSMNSIPCSLTISESQMSINIKFQNHKKRESQIKRIYKPQVNCIIQMLTEELQFSKCV